MYVTQLNFNDVLEWFYNRNRKYDFMLLFVSSFDGNDKNILNEVVSNAWRIDRITGDRISFIYFTEKAKNYSDIPFISVNRISDWSPEYGNGVNVTMRTADDISRHFGLLRSNLPAFVLVSKDESVMPEVFSVKNYNDLENFLAPLNIIHSYLDDKRVIISQYEKERQKTVVTQSQVDRRNERRESFNIAIKKLELKKAKEVQLGMYQKASNRDIEIQFFKDKLEENPELAVHEEDEVGLGLLRDEQLNFIKKKSVERLNISLNSNCGESIINLIQDPNNYHYAVLKIWNLVRMRDVHISRVLENIRAEINDKGFNVFISCKSEDYNLACDLYEFLKFNGFRPFLADKTIKEIGIEQYTPLIGEVIDVCNNMIVFATEPNYIVTPYVSAEWNLFVNDINTGKKTNARIVNILSPKINIHSIPAWLRDKQSFTTDNYKDGLLNFLVE